MSVIVLTYHACNIMGNDYADNDHVALAQDLQTLAEKGFELVDLADAVTAGLSGTGKSLVALTFDDGPIFDFEDFEHPNCGFQKSFYRSLVATGRGFWRDPDRKPQLGSQPPLVVQNRPQVQPARRF
jgi:hypothetical protein